MASNPLGRSGVRSAVVDVGDENDSSSAGLETSDVASRRTAVIEVDRPTTDRRDIPPPHTEIIPASPVLIADPVVQLSARRLRRTLILADAVAVVVGFAIAFAAWAVVRNVPASMRYQHAGLAAMAVPAWACSLAANKVYSARAVERFGEEFRRIWTACAFGVMAIIALAFAFRYQSLSRSLMLLVLVSIGISLTVERYTARRVFLRLRASGRISRRVAIIGTDGHAVDLMRTMQANPHLGYNVIGLLGEYPSGERRGPAPLGSTSNVEQLLRDHGCTGVIVSLASVQTTEVNRLTRRLTDHGFHVALSSSLRDIAVTRIRPQSVDGQTMIYIEPTIRDGWRAIAKRAFDLVIAIFALLLSAPVLLASAVLIKLETGGPVLFRQTRIGRDERPFQIVKLRTMSVDAEARRDEFAHLNESDGPLFKVRADPRVTRVGRFLRKWSIDELPQFLNVIAGSMSVVGPRPALPDEVAQWDPEVKERLRVLPGITGLWQVHGRASTTFDVYKRLDLYYVDNWSLLHDLRIVLKTFVAVLQHEGAS